MTPTAPSASLDPARSLNAPAALPRLAAPASILAAALAALAVAALFPTVKTLVATWFDTAAYYHGIFVAPVAILLARRLGGPDAAPQLWPPALAGAALALLAWLAGRAANVNLVEQAAFVSLLIAIVAFAFGPHHAARWKFPLAFLFFMVPFGGALLPVLQTIAAHGALALLKLTGVPSALDGTILTVGKYRFGIAEACAGLNFLIAAVIVAALFAHFAFARWRKAAVFIAAAAIAAIAANAFRAYIIVLAASLSDGRIAMGLDHVVIGWALYCALLFALVTIGRRFADWPVDTSARPAARRSEPYRAAPAFVAASLLLLAGAAAWDRAVINSAPAHAAPAQLAWLSAGGWRALPAADGWTASLDHADRKSAALYQSGDFLVLTNAGWFTHDRPGAEIAGYDTRTFDNDAWKRMASEPRRFRAFGAERTLAVDTIENGARTRLSAVTVYWYDGAVFADAAAVKLAVAKNRFLGRQRPGGALVLAAPESHGGSAALQAFFLSAEPLEQWIARSAADAD